MHDAGYVRRAWPRRPCLAIRPARDYALCIPSSGVLKYDLEAPHLVEIIVKRKMIARCPCRSARQCACFIPVCETNAAGSAYSGVQRRSLVCGFCRQRQPLRDFWTAVPLPICYLRPEVSRFLLSLPARLSAVEGCRWQRSCPDITAFCPERRIPYVGKRCER